MQVPAAELGIQVDSFALTGANPSIAPGFSTFCTVRREYWFTLRSWPWKYHLANVFYSRYSITGRGPVFRPSAIVHTPVGGCHVALGAGAWRLSEFLFMMMHGSPGWRSHFE
jgi:hypothetical protein